MNASQKFSLRHSFRGFLILLFLAVFETLTFAQVDQWGAWENGINGITESWWLSSKTFTTQEAAEAIAQWKRIGEAEASISRAGDYFSGSETHGTYVRWSEKGFVIANVDKCQALVMCVTYGRVEVTPTLIKFFPEFSKSTKTHGHSHSPARELSVMSFVPARWRDLLLLIPEYEVVDFSDYVAGLGNFNALLGFNPFDVEGSFFYSKWAGKRVTTDDSPVVPDEYRSLIKKPIVATLTAVEGRQLKRHYSYEAKSKILSFATQHDLASLTYVRLNIGRRHGAKKGLFLRVSHPDLGDVVRLIHVGETSSRGVLVREVENGKETYYDNEAERERSYPRVAAGWTLTTARP